MRNVLGNTSEVLHAWANQTQESARCGNVSFNGERLRSYAAEIASLVIKNGVPVAVLQADRHWSATTSGHQYGARSAARHLPSWIVKELGTEPRHHAENVEYFREKIRSACIAAGRARADKTHRLREIERLVEEARSYCKFFKLRAKFALPSDFDVEKAKEMADEYDRKNREKLKKQARERQKYVEKQWAEYDGKLQRWLAGENGDQPPSNIGSDRDGFDHLRLRGSRIQTTSGAVVDVEEAKAVIPLVRAGVLRTWTTWSEDDPSPIISGFRVKEVEADGTLHVGCHKIRGAEIERGDALLGL
jgi:hypothetical protein